MKSKEEFLLYKNPAILRRYVKDCGVSYKEADSIWVELMKYLYLASYCIHTKANSGLMFFGQVNNKIDEMWHKFLLFTKDYREFCDCYCGVFIDHIPNTNSDESELLRNPGHYQKFKENLKEYLKLVHEIWGEETFKKWFVSKDYK